ncbi:ROK family glucokinase [Staphylococcus sp. 17KM0847]|uniref:ROK family glucokinase n=1 Tax=Staphylococcus sp. 17KM0847 TaxID=2583989 RepID=UPI0015DD4628|nr:ROK family glucokinase [Staphylococcus sp. 17KM0847]QLK86072.1 ROK family glucokinase [Staphylococcus sp. 17KM0847]
MRGKIILAVDIGGTTCKLGIFDETLTRLAKWSIKTDTSDPTGVVLLKKIHEAFREQCEVLNYNIEDAVGMGIGVPGPVSFEAGIVHGAINLNWSDDVNVVRLMQSFVECPVVVDNDANIAALGEKFLGAGQNEANIVAITLGTGVGGGIIANHQIIHGHNGSGAELGHIRVDHDQRFSCNCGKSGCIETVASATGIVNLALFYYPKLALQSMVLPYIEKGTLTAKEIFDAAKVGDSFCLFIVEKAARYIAYLASILSVTTNPKYIILGGGVSEAGDILIENVKEAYHQLTFKPAQKDTHIVRAALGNEAGIVGAAGLIKTYILNKE